MTDCPLCYWMARTFWVRMRVRYWTWRWRFWCRLGLHRWLTGYQTTWCSRGCGARREDPT